MIPFHKPLDISHQWPVMEDDLKNILKTRRYSGGKHLKAFEDLLTEVFDARYAIACSSGTMALVLAIKAVNPQPGNRPQVMIPSFAFSGIRDAVYLARGDMYYCDIYPDTWLGDFEHRNITDKIVLNVHTFGNIGFAPDREYGAIIHDASHAWGIDPRDTFPIGNATILSMAPSKAVTAMEGGVILTDSSKVYDICTTYRDMWSRITEMQAIIGFWYVMYGIGIHNRHKKIWDFYKEKIRYYGETQVIKEAHSYNYFGLKVTREGWWEKIIKNAVNKVAIRRFYDPPLVQNKNSMDLAGKIIQFPVYPGIEKEKVIEILLEGEIDSEFDRAVC